MKKGVLIAFEGADGSGKTTALNRTADYLQDLGYTVIKSREPGGTPAAEDIRAVLLNSGFQLDPKTEALLFAAARNEHVKNTILPAIEAGQVVLSDRFLDSSLAYQGAGRKLGLANVEALNDYVLDGFRPDLVFLFDAPLEVLSSRIKKRGQSNDLDHERDAFYQDVQRGYQILSDHMMVIDASVDEDNVFKQVKDILDAFLAGQTAEQTE